MGTTRRGGLGKTSLIVLACVLGIAWLGYRFAPGQAATAWQVERRWRVNESFNSTAADGSLMDMTLDFRTRASAMVEVYHQRGSMTREEWDRRHAADAGPGGPAMPRPQVVERIATIPCKRSWLTGRAKARVAVSVSTRGVWVASDGLPDGPRRSSLDLGHLPTAASVVVSKPHQSGADRYGAWYELGTGQCFISFHSLSAATGEAPATVTWEEITFYCKEVYGGGEPDVSR